MEIRECLKGLGIPVNLNGYRFLVEAVELATKDKTYLRGICKRLYPTIATNNGVTMGCVERGIRYAINMSSLRGDYDLMQEIFGNSINPESGIATNQEFIATLVEYVGMKEGSGNGN